MINVDHYGHYRGLFMMSSEKNQPTDMTTVIFI